MALLVHECSRNKRSTSLNFGRFPAMDRADPRGTTKRLFSLAGQETELLLDGKSQ